MAYAPESKDLPDWLASAVKLEAEIRHKTCVNDASYTDRDEYHAVDKVTSKIYEIPISNESNERVPNQEAFGAPTFTMLCSLLGL